MLLVSIVIHAMMQQFTVAEDLDCSKISCFRDCIQSSNFTSHSNALHLSSNPQLMTCCNLKCRKSCISDGQLYLDGSKWLDSDDACATHICNDGHISTHISMCYGLPCPIEHHIRAPGECCSQCDPNWASFCPEEVDCDRACQFGFEVDPKRRCDLCRCARKKLETSSTSTTAEPSSVDDATRTIHYYFYLDPTEGATKNLVLGLAVACGVLLVVCLAGIAWFFHRKVYKRVPLMSLNNSKA